MARRRHLVLAALLVGLVGFVALASRAHAPAGAGGTRRVNGSLALEYVLLAIIALGAVGLPIVAWAIWRARGQQVELPKRGNWMSRTLITAAVIALAGAAYATYRATHHGGRSSPAANAKAGTLRTRRLPSLGTGHATPARFDWVPAIVVFSAVGGGVAATVLLSRRRRAGAPREVDLAAQLSAVLDDSLDDLLAERDPRKAVIVAYARMEQVLARAGLPRRAAETPLEYLARALQELLSASAASVSRLTALFERAKFSHHDIDTGMKDEAIAALLAVRDELRPAAA